MLPRRELSFAPILGKSGGKPPTTDTKPKYGISSPRLYIVWRESDAEQHKEGIAVMPQRQVVSAPAVIQMHVFLTQTFKIGTTNYVYHLGQVLGWHQANNGPLQLTRDTYRTTHLSICNAAWVPSSECIVAKYLCRRDDPDEHGC